MSNDLAQVTAQLEEDIVFGRRRPRERLIEDELVAQFGAKKHVVRQALVDLERMGLVERKRNKGALVRDYTPADVENIYAVREMLEGRAAADIPLPASADLIEALTAVQAEHREAVERGDIARAFRVNITFHQTLFAACGNPHLVEAINLFAFKSHGVRSYSLARPELLRKARDEHEAMIEALKTGDRERLVALCVGHLRPSAQAYTDAYDRLFGGTLRQSA